MFLVDSGLRKVQTCSNRFSQRGNRVLFVDEMCRAVSLRGFAHQFEGKVFERGTVYDPVNDFRSTVPIIVWYFRPWDRNKKSSRTSKKKLCFLRKK